MGITRELVLQPADLSHISIRCTSCKARVEISREDFKQMNAMLDQKKKASIPARCPSCDDPWEKVRFAVQKLFEGLDGLDGFEVNFRVSNPPS